MNDLSTISTATGIATSIIGRLNPVAGLISGQLSWPSAMAVFMNDIATGNLSDTEIAIAGLGTVPASSSVLTLTARTLGLLALGGLAVGATTAGLATGLALGVAVAAALATPAVRDILTDPDFWDAMKKGLNDPSKIPDLVSDFFSRAQNWIQPRDPLVFDLDGDGIEAVGINPANPILFDHNADGVKTGTGWIKADDGLLVLDINGNGMIDSGRELFGDNTLLPSGQLAANGYTALAQHDANADGKINSADAVYTQLRVWQDANQDGISQAAELKTLAQLNIASINVTGTASNINLGGGNTQPFSGSFTRTDGSTGASGVAELSGSLLLAANTFYSEFTDAIPLTDLAKTLPGMSGSGLVRVANDEMWRKAA